MNNALTKSLLDELDTLTQGLVSGRLSATEWHNEVARTLFAYHLAAYAEASGKDERDVLAAVKKIVGKQVDFLNKFTDDIEAGRYTDKDALLQARATLYAGALRGTYYQGKYPALKQVPGDGNTQCLGNCRCDLTERDDGIYWELHADESCSDCEAMAAGSPYGSERKAIDDWAVKHLRGKHDQRSHGRGGGRGLAGGSEPVSPDVQRKLQNIDAELANKYTSPGRRQALEKRRQELLGTSSAPAASSSRTGDSTSISDDQKLQNIDAELANPYMSPGRRQALEARRRELQPATTERDLKQELDAAETESRGLKHERATFFGPDGKQLVQVNGDEKSYTLSDREFNSLRGAGATMTHNHPGGHKYAASDPRHQGHSFSIQDIRQAAALNLAEIRAVTPTRRYWMKPPKGGWKEKHWKTEIPNSYQKHHKAVLSEMVQQVRSGRLSVEQADARVYHEVWSRVSKELGLSYGYEDR